MKNKLLTYVLLAAVVVIWAWIMFSVFSFMDGSDSPVFAGSPVRTKTVHTDTTGQMEYVLSLQYKDPFLKKEYYSYRMNQTRSMTSTPHSASSVVHKKTDKQEKATTPIEKIILPSVNYVGRITTAKRPVAILLIRNGEYMMRENETVDGITLNEIKADSVKVTYQNTTFYVRKN